MDDIALMGELRPVLARLFERHLATTKEWFPHALVPWDRGAALDATATWRDDAMALPRAVRSAL
ncbi:MAG TPA: acyl-ACP desaturase, partial [Acidimicrobiia bacterium]|nr:acyl-ACP desaturase [Acidimicrobiia bacterium]